MRFIATIVIAATLAVAAPAQDTLKLLDGTLHRGVILDDGEDSVRMVTKDGVVVTAKRADIKLVRRGKALASKIANRLESVDRDDADGLFAVAEWAAKVKSLRKDSGRVALMAVAADTDHADARALLGHVHALGVWHPSFKEAAKAVAEEMKARDYKKYGDGWADPSVIADVKAEPDAWMVDGFEWKLVATVLRERGLTEWGGVWYREDERHVIAECNRLKERIDVTAHGARVGANVVVCFQGREVAEQNAKRLDRARRWFVKAFDAAHTGLIEGPESTHFVLESRGELGDFGRAYGDVHGLDETQLKFYMPTGSIPYNRLDHAVDVARERWEAALVSQIGGRLLKRFLWNGGFDMPDWMWIAAAHHAEIAVFGEAVIWYIAPDEYGRREEARKEEGRSVSSVKTALADMSRAGKLPTLDQLFRARTNTMTADLDSLGIGYLAYFLQERKDAWLAFIGGMRSTDGDCEARFRGHFGKGWTETHAEFRAWLGK